MEGRGDGLQKDSSSYKLWGGCKILKTRFFRCAAAWGPASHWAAPPGRLVSMAASLDVASLRASPSTLLISGNEQNTMISGSLICNFYFSLETVSLTNQTFTCTDEFILPYVNFSLGKKIAWLMLIVFQIRMSWS